MEIATIGFTQSTAERFFERLRAARIERLVDIRLNNVSQLAGFAKSADLRYFLRVICNADYEHDLRLAPVQELLDGYRGKQASWDAYEQQFLALMRERGVPDVIDRAPYERKTALLCSEATPERCHRRLVAGLLAERWGARVEHL
ncbi:MAG: DUF488 domain-containing protein [Chloroflexi bacterium]|nr:DUF488 domain-containing protein [Chloroflexota bacterium]